MLDRSSPQELETTKKHLEINHVAVDVVSIRITKDQNDSKDMKEATNN